MARILIVDDNLLCRHLLNEILGGAGHDIVGEAVDGLEAPTFVRDLRPDLVTLDLIMPRRGGLGTLQHLMLLDHTQPVVLSAAFPTPWQVHSALKLGARGLIMKPFERESLLEVVESALHGMTPRAVPEPRPQPAVPEPAIVESVEEPAGDQREFVRVNAALQVVVVTMDTEESVHTFTMNLSGSGMLLASGSFTLRQYVRFTILLDRHSEPVRGNGRVVRFDQHGRAAIEFERIAYTDHSRLVGYIRANQTPELARTG